MAKRQREISRLGEEMLAVLDKWFLETDIEEKDKLNAQYKILRMEYEKVKWDVG